MQWEDIPEDSWQDVAGGGDPIPLVPELKRRGKAALGGLDAALTTAAQAIPFIGSGLIAGASVPFIGANEAENFRKDMMESAGVKPVTQEGTEILEAVGKGAEFIKNKAGEAAQKSRNPFTLEESDSYGNKARLASDLILGGWGAFSPVPGGKAVRKMGKGVEAWRDSNKPKVSPKKDLVWEDVGSFDEKAAKASDNALLERLKQVDREVTLGENAKASKTQADLDKELTGLQVSYLHDQSIMDRLKAIDAEVTKGERGPQYDPVRNEMFPGTDKAVKADDTIYVDPQEQAFRGNPAEADARLSLEKQTEAMDRELTHLRGKGTPEGEPLRPLQDVERAERMGEARDLRIAEMEESLNKLVEEHKAERDPFKGPGKRQAGAVDLGIQKMVERALKSGMLDNFIRKSTKQEWNESARAYNIPTTEAVSEAVSLVGPAEFRRLAKEHPSVKDAGPEWDAISNELTARQIVDFFDSMGSGNNAIKYVPLKQRGAVGRDLKQRVDVSKKQQLMAERFKKNLGLDEWDTLRDKEVALELAKESYDVARNFGQKNLVSGLNMSVAMSNNPMLKFARTVLRDARTNADKFSRTYITDPKVGLTPVWNKMKPQEKVDVIQALMEADRRQVELTPQLMDQLGFTDKMKQFAETFRKADEQLLQMQNKMANELGMKPTDRRTGHFPGIFTGAYKALAVVGEGKKQQVVAVLATDTKAQLKVAMEHIKKEKPNVRIVEQPRLGLTRFRGNRYYSDIFSGWKNVLDLLGREDQRFADVQEIVNKALMDANNALFNFNVHELSKKGVIGNEGNKPWLNAKENADQAFSALVRYFEEGSLHHSIQKPLKDIKDLMTAPETDSMPNARKYMQDYLNKVHQQDVNDIGNAINTILDEPFKYIPSVSWDKNGNKTVGVGIGPGVPLKITGALKNNMAQIYMGWFNWAFTGSQFIQPLQTGLPFMQIAAGRIGASPEKVVASIGKGTAQFMSAFVEMVSGRDIGTNPLHKEAFKYAVDRGLFEFSEIEKAYQGTQGTLSRTKDRLAEANMKLGEQATRTPMFMSFVDLLVGEGMEKKKAFEIAENLTQAAMIDYHQWERPMLYSKLGVMGGLMAGLTTFKHGYMSQQTYLAKQAIKPAVGKRSEAVLPIVYSAAAMLALSGITGLPFYSELDTVYRAITNAFGGESKSIRDSVLENNPEWINSGLISSATNLNWQSKFSSSDMVPDNAAKAISPHLEGASRIGMSIYDVFKNGADPQSVRNFATAATPAGYRGVAEDALARDENDNLIGKDGLPAYQRTPKEWDNRSYRNPMALGLRSQREAIDREKVWEARLKERADTDRRKEINQEYRRRLTNNTMDEQSQHKLEQEYQDRKGDVRELLKLWQDVALDKQKTEKERLEGTPNSLRGVNRWNYYNR